MDRPNYLETLKRLEEKLRTIQMIPFERFFNAKAYSLNAAFFPLVHPSVTLSLMMVRRIRKSKKKELMKKKDRVN
jgi:hypothetical protein